MAEEKKGLTVRYKVQGVRLKAQGTGFGDQGSGIRKGRVKSEKEGVKRAWRPGVRCRV